MSRVAPARSTGADGVRTLRLDDGTTGRLVPAAPWSWHVQGVDGRSGDAWLDAAERWAADAGVLDLRHDGAAAGFAPLVPGTGATEEHVRAVVLPLPDAEATRALGRRMAGHLRPGDLLVLAGPLGAGKTTFTQGLGEGLGVRGRVTSPTFVLARVHRGPLPLVHVDAYRLRDPGAGGDAPLDLDDLDLEAALEDSVTVVEWGQGMVERLADAHLALTFGRAYRGKPDTGRTVQVRAHGRRWSGGPEHKVTAQTRGGGPLPAQG